MTSKKEFDVLDFSTAKKSNEGAVMNFNHPATGEPLTHQTKEDKAPRGLHLVLLGPESPEAQRVFLQLQNRAKRKGENHVPSDDEIETNRVADSKAIARLVVGGLLFTGGKWVEVTKDNAGDFLFEIGPLRSQAVSFVIDSGNYLENQD